MGNFKNFVLNLCAFFCHFYANLIKFPRLKIGILYMRWHYFSDLLFTIILFLQLIDFWFTFFIWETSFFKAMLMQTKLFLLTFLAETWEYFQKVLFLIFFVTNITFVVAGIDAKCLVLPPLKVWCVFKFSLGFKLFPYNEKHHFLPQT